MAGADRAGDVAGIGEDLIRRADEIATTLVTAWREAPEEAWLALPPDLTLDHLPELIRSLARGALVSFFDEQQRDALVWTAVEHGEQRRLEGHDENLIYHEYTLLRRALWNHMRERYATTGRASAAVVRLDAGISLAIGASLRGFYRSMLEEQGDWPGVVERLSREFAFLGID